MPQLHYNSFQDFLADCEAARKSLKYAIESYDTQIDDWLGNATYDEALSLARNGWPTGTAKVQGLTANITSKLTSLIEVPTIQYDVTGMDYDIGLYLSGRPECWYNFENSVQEGTGTTIVRMVYNYGARFSVSPEAMIARGVVAASLVVLLEQTGRRVELIACNRTEEGTDIRIPVKMADWDLDIDRLSFILAHPAMLRRLGFAIRRHKGNAKGWGDDRSIELGDTERGDIYFNAGIGDEWRNEASALAYVKQELAKQGVAIRE